MTIEDDETAQTDLHRRVKRVEARELSETEAQALAAEADRPAVVAPPPVPPPGDRTSTAIDPTLYLARERRHSHELIYRAAQIATAASMGLSAAGIILCLFHDHGDAALGSIFGAVASIAAYVAMRLSHRTRLSSRVGGYAIAALVMGLVCLAGNLVTYGFSESETPDGAPRLNRGR